MSTGSRFGWNGELPASAGPGLDGRAMPESKAPSREVDERTAIYLLSLARELLRRDHSAIAGMIDYAIAEIEVGSGSDG